MLDEVALQTTVGRSPIVTAEELAVKLHPSTPGCHWETTVFGFNTKGVPHQENHRSHKAGAV